MPSTVAQVNEALALATRTRLDRQALKRELRAVPTAAEGRARVADLLADPPEFLDGMAIYDLLIAPRRAQRRHTRRLLERHHIGELRTVGELTERQREVLAAELRGKVVT